MAEPVARGFVEIAIDKLGFGKSVDSLGEGEHERVGQVIGQKIGGGLSSAFKVAAAGATATLVAGLAVGAGLYKIGDDFNKAFDTIRVGTGATGDALKGLEGDMKAVFASTPASMKDTGTAIADLNTKLNLSGKPLEDLSTQFLNLSRITKTDVAANIDVASKAFNNFGVNAADQGKSLDYLFKVSQSTGIGFDKLSGDLAGNGVVLRQAGLGFDAAATLLGSLSKAGLDAGDVMPGLSKALAAAAKEGKPAQQVISDTFKAIKEAPSDTVAAGDALAVFGAKGGPKLAAAIREGKLSYDDLMKSLESSPETINKAAKDTEHFGEKFQVLKNRILVDLEPLATRVFEGVGRAMDKLGPVIDRMVGAFREFGERHGPAISAWVTETLVPALQSFGGILGNIGDWIIGSLVPALISLGQGFIAAFGFVMDHKEILVGLGAAVGVVLVYAFVAWAWATWQVVVAQIALWAPLIALALAIGALVAGVIYAYTHWDFFREAVDKVRDALVWLFENVLKPVGEWIINSLVPWVRDKLIPAFEDFGRKIGSMASTLAGWVVDVWNAGGQVLDFFRELPDKIAGFFSTLYDYITAPFREAFAWVKKEWDNSIGAIVDKISSVKDSIGGAVSSVGGFLTGRASGGPVTKGTPYVVGEKRPELFVPDSNGYVMPAVPDAGGGGPAMVNTFYTTQPREIASELSWLMRTQGGRV